MYIKHIYISKLPYKGGQVHPTKICTKKTIYFVWTSLSYICIRNIIYKCAVRLCRTLYIANIVFKKIKQFRNTSRYLYILK